MKKVLMGFLLMLCLTSIAYSLTYSGDYYERNIRFSGKGGEYDPIKLFMNEVAGKVGGETGTGTIYYVDSGVASAGAGTSVTTAVATIQEGIDLCTANAGDIVYVMPGHAENAASAAVIDFDCAGMTLYCLGEGEDMPTVSLTTAASATVQISAADVAIYGLRILGNYTNGITEALDITADGDGYRILNCEFRETSATKELLKMVTVTADADEGTIAGCKFIGIATGTDSIAISLEGGSDYTNIIYNDFYGDWSGYPIDGTTAASVGLNVCYNRMNNLDTGAGKTIAFHSSTTGNIIGNTLYGNGTSFAIVADAMFVSPDNVCMATENVETRNYATMFGPYRGDAAGTAGDSIYADFVLAQSDLDAIIARQLTEDANVSAIAAALVVTDGIADDIKARLITTDANVSAMATALAAVAGDVNGTTTIAGRTYATQITGVTIADNDLFLVAGGPIMITSFVGEVTTVIPATACTTKIWVNATEAGLDYDFSTAVDIQSAVDGGRIIFSNANPSVLTPLALGATGAGSLMSPWYCVPGMIAVLDSDDNTPTGAITWSMTWIPLVDGVTVTAQ